MKKSLKVNLCKNDGCNAVIPFKPGIRVQPIFCEPCRKARHEASIKRARAKVTKERRQIYKAAEKAAAVSEFVVAKPKKRPAINPLELERRDMEQRRINKGCDARSRALHDAINTPVAMQLMAAGFISRRF